MRTRLTKIRALLAAPVFEDDDEKTRVAGLLNIVLWTITATAIARAIQSLALAPDDVLRTVLPGAGLLLAFGLRFLMHKGNIQFVSSLLVTIVFVLISIIAFNLEGTRSPALVAYPVVILMASLLLGERAGIAFAVLSILTVLGLAYTESIEILPAALIPLETTAVAISTSLALVTLTVLLSLYTRTLNAALEHTRRNERALAENNLALEASRNATQAQSRELGRRTRYLEATTAVAREAAAVLDMQELLTRVVTLVSEQFGFYHTGIFLIDPSGEWAELQAASSEGGRRMLARGHRLRVGQQGIVGYVTRRGEPRIALDVGADAAHFDNPDLPHTRSEMALPLRARGDIIGALDVQSTEPEAFSGEDIAVLQALADQVALSISNARLIEQAQKSLQAQQRAFGELSREAWQSLLQKGSELGFLSDERGVSPAGDLWEPQMKTALQRGELVPDAKDKRALAVPIKVRGHVIGVIDAQKPGGTSEWTPEESQLLETLTEQLGVALESTRLYQDTQRHAAQEQLISHVTARIRETLDMDTVLQTAVREIGEALGIAEVEVRMGGGLARPEDRRNVAPIEQEDAR